MSPLNTEMTLEEARRIVAYHEGPSSPWSIDYDYLERLCRARELIDASEHQSTERK